MRCASRSSSAGHARHRVTGQASTKRPGEYIKAGAPTTSSSTTRAEWARVVRASDLRRARTEQARAEEARRQGRGALSPRLFRARCGTGSPSSPPTRPCYSPAIHRAPVGFGARPSSWVIPGSSGCIPTTCRRSTPCCARHGEPGNARRPGAPLAPLRTGRGAISTPSRWTAWRARGGRHRGELP